MGVTFRCGSGPAGAVGGWGILHGHLLGIFRPTDRMVPTRLGGVGRWVKEENMVNIHLCGYNICNMGGTGVFIWLCT